MSHVQFAPAVSDDIRQTPIHLETKTVVVSL